MSSVSSSSSSFFVLVVNFSRVADGLAVAVVTIGVLGLVGSLGLLLTSRIPWSLISSRLVPR